MMRARQHLLFVYILFAAIVMCTYSCLDTIELSLPASGGGRLVIDGVITQSELTYDFLVHVSQTVSTSDAVVGDLKDAVIGLQMDGADVMELQNGQSLSISIESFHNQYGGTPYESFFRLMINVDGQNFVSEEIRIPQSPPPGTLTANLIERSELNDFGAILENQYIELRLDGSLLNQRNERVSLLWEVSGVYEFPEIPWTDNPFFFPKVCYVDVPGRTNEINLIRSDLVEGNTFQQYKITETEADFRFYSGFFYTVVQRTLDSEAAFYWDEIKSGVEREGTIFDVPPGRIMTNISPTSTDAPEVLGYFYGTSVDTLRKLTTREETGEQSHLCRFQLLESPCCSCLDLLFSSLEKPPYWE